MKTARERGFTLVELMAVLGILAIIAIIAVPAIGTILKNAESSSDEATVRMIEKSAEVAHTAESANHSKKSATYSVEQLVSGGFLDYNHTAPGALNGFVGYNENLGFTYTGYNLIDTSQVKRDRYIVESNGNEISSGQYKHIATDFIPVNGDEIFTYQNVKPVGQFRISQYDANKKYIRGDNMGNQPTVFQFSTGSDAKYIRFSTRHQDMTLMDLNLMKLERGRTATPLTSFN